LSVVEPTNEDERQDVQGPRCFALGRLPKTIGPEVTIPWDFLYC